MIDTKIIEGIRAKCTAFRRYQDSNFTLSGPLIIKPHVSVLFFVNFIFSVDYGSFSKLLNQPGVSKVLYGGNDPSLSCIP